MTLILFFRSNQNAPNHLWDSNIRSIHFGKTRFLNLFAHISPLPHCGAADREADREADQARAAELFKQNGRPTRRGPYAESDGVCACDCRLNERNGSRRPGVGKPNEFL